MYPTTPTYDEAIKFSHRPVTVVEWATGRDEPWQPLIWFDGDMTCDSGATSRWSLNLSMPFLPEGFDVLGCRTRVHRGLYIPRVGEFLVPWGVHRVNSISETRDGVSIEASSFEKQIEDARFPKPRRVGGIPKKGSLGPDQDQGSFETSVVAGLTYREVIETLVTEAVPDAYFEFRTDAVNQKVRSFIQEKDRWELLDGGNKDTSIAAALGIEMFFDGRGAFVVQDLPAVTDDVVWNMDDSEYPVITDISKDQNRDSLYNLVVASGQSTTGDPPVGPGYAWDNSPTSRTYAGPDPVNNPQLAGDFGVVPMFMVSIFFTHQNQCSAAAAAQIRRSLGIKKTMSASTISNYALEPGDVVQSSGERHLISSWRASLKSGTMDFDTLATREDLSDVDVEQSV